MTLLIATGLLREARIMAGPDVEIVAGGGDGERLEAALERAIAVTMPHLILSSGLAGALDPNLVAGDVVMDGEPGLWAMLAEALPDARSGSILGHSSTLSKRKAMAIATNSFSRSTV